MQRLNPTKLRRLPFELSFVLASSFLASGCSATLGPSLPEDNQPLHGATLRLSCPDNRLRSLFEPMVKVWAHRTGATVEVTRERMAPDDAIDLGVIQFSELGTWADRGDLVPLAGTLRETGHALQWSSILGVYRGESYAGWGGHVFGLPLAADGSLLIYRADRIADPQEKAEFRKRFGRTLAAPATWEEFADMAAYFSERDKRPCLPRFTADPDRLEDLFFRIAACYDRPAHTGEGLDNPESLAFQFRLDSGKPRLEEKGFVAAGRWLVGLKDRGCIPDEGTADPVEALVADRAVLAVLTMSDLARLKRNGRVNERFTIAPLPGTAAFVNPATGALSPTKANSIPYFAGGWLGVARRGCKHPDAAFALLAELGGPARSQEILAAGGFGPVRDTHLEPDRLLVWLGYGFDETRSKALQEALRAGLGKSVRNPAYGLRTPDQSKLRELLRVELTKIAGGQATPEAGLKSAAAAWDRANAGEPQEKLLGWRRRAAGLN